MSATDRMIDFAFDIAEEMGIEPPDFDDFEETSEFISENKAAYYSSVNGAD